MLWVSITWLSATSTVVLNGHLTLPTVLSSNGTTMSSLFSTVFDTNVFHGPHELTTPVLPAGHSIPPLLTSCSTSQIKHSCIVPGPLSSQRVAVDVKFVHHFWDHSRPVLGHWAEISPQRGAPSVQVLAGMTRDDVRAGDGLDSRLAGSAPHSKAQLTNDAQ